MFLRGLQALSPACSADCGPRQPVEYSLGSGVVELVLPRAAEAGLHTVVGPEPPDNAGQVLWEHTLLLGRARQCKQLPGVILGTAVGGQPVTGTHPYPTCQGQGGHQNGAKAGVLNSPRT